MKTTILYKDVAPGAAEDADISAPGGLKNSHASLLADGVTPPPVITLERNAWVLDGSHKYMDDCRIAFWSEELSDKDCAFQNPPVITVLFDKQYSSTGLTVVFDESSGNRCSLVNVKWYQGETLKADVDFEPDTTQYFCQQKVTSYNKIVITLLKTSLPFRRARLNRIVFGVLRTFGMTEIRKATITNEMDLMSSELPISELKWTLDSGEDAEFLFQLKQPMEVRNGDSLVGVYYVDEARRVGSGLYEIECFDAIGVLSESPFSGGVYADKSASELLAEIIGNDFALEIEAEDTTLTGAILPCTRREAVQQILFAWGVCASTDGRESIRVFVPNGDPVEIGLNRTFLGASVETSAIVTRVVVTAHSYVKTENGNLTINGENYEDVETTYSVDNPDVTASDKQRVVEVESATMVSPSIGQTVAQRVYDYYARRNTNSAQIVWQGEQLGDSVTVPNSWGSVNTGNINRMEIKLSNTVVATCRTVGS